MPTAEQVLAKIDAKLDKQTKLGGINRTAPGMHAPQRKWRTMWYGHGVYSDGRVCDGGLGYLPKMVNKWKVKKLTEAGWPDLDDYQHSMDCAALRQMRDDPYLGHVREAYEEWLDGKAGEQVDALYGALGELHAVGLGERVMELKAVKHGSYTTQFSGRLAAMESATGGLTHDFIKLERAYRDLSSDQRRMLAVSFGGEADDDGPDNPGIIIEYDTSMECRWGDMKIMEPPRTVPMRKARLATPNLRFREIGATPFLASRWATARYTGNWRCFGRPVIQEESLAILVDVSGSMGWDFRKLEELLARFPLSTIAYYSGGDHNGTLTVYAKGGMRAESIERKGGNNIVDGPALRWLAQQPGRKLWLSDGQVTGRSESTTGGLWCDAMAVCMEARILRVDQHEIVPLLT